MPGTEKSKEGRKNRCAVCGRQEELCRARCTCGATVTLCAECYSERESAEGGGLIEECPACTARD